MGGGICFLKTPSSWTLKFVSGSVGRTFGNAPSKLLKVIDQGPELQCLLRVKEDLS